MSGDNISLGEVMTDDKLNLATIYNSEVEMIRNSIIHHLATLSLSHVIIMNLKIY